MDSISPVIHLGLQKTASTFLQKEVFGPLDAFHTPWDILSANAIEHFVLQHPSKFDVEIIRRDLEAPAGKTTVVSHEDLIGFPVLGRYYAEQTIRRIAHALPRARMLVVVREQRSMLLSNYFQQVRQGGTLTISQMLAENVDRTGFRPRLRLDHFEYDLTYDLLRQYFPADQILMLPFELLQFDKAGFVSRLSQFSGVDIRPTIGEKIVNKKRGPAAMRVERVLNRFMPNPENLPASYVQYPIWVRGRNRIVRVIDKFTQDTQLSKRHKDSLRQFIEDFVGDYYDESNQRLGALLSTDLAALGYRVGTINAHSAVHGAPAFEASAL